MAAAVIALGHARAVLDGDHAVPARHVARLAAALARQALEEAVEAVGIGAMREASMRVRLIGLRVDDRTAVVAADAALAWRGLSRACHHHSYELAPTVDEVGHLIDQVAALIPVAYDAAARVTR
ncbi:hypothetical protein [Alloactinosynnema sp. L-07]|nr:hypothetical protein [Alloactinosynnema sp. L-07]